MPKPACVTTYSGVVNPDTLLLSVLYTIAGPMTAGTTYTLTHGLTVDEADFIGFAANGLELVGPIIPTPGFTTTKFDITPSTDYGAGEVTVRVFGKLTTGISMTDVLLGSRVTINVPMTAGVQYAFLHGATLNDANFIAFDGNGIELPACNIVVDPANPQTGFLITPAHDYLAGIVRVRAFGNQ